MTNYSRADYVFLAKVYEKAEKFEEMVDFIVEYCKLDPKLSPEERAVLSSGFKNVIASKRSSWRFVNKLYRKEKKKEIEGNKNLEWIEEIKQRISTEMKAICDKVQSVLDEHLIKNVSDSENEVYYLKLKADYHRYYSDFVKGEEKEEAIEQARTVYEKAYEIAKAHLHISNSTHLGLALNISVFYYEITGEKDKACSIANQAFEESFNIIDDLEKRNARDTMLIIQLLKENLILWNNEMEGENAA